MPRTILIASGFACLAAALVAQNDLQSYMARAVAELAQPATVADACRKLENIGPRIVPYVRGLLHWSHKAETSVAQREQLIYVLGRLGKHAMPALPELRDILRDSDETLAMQAVWTLGNLAPFLDEETGDAVRADLDHAPRAARDCAQAGRLAELLRLGPKPGRQRLEWCLRYGDSVAASSWLCLNADHEFDGKRELAELVAEQLDAHLLRHPIDFDKGARYGTDDLAMAKLALGDGTLDLATARGLLQHWDANERLRAVLWLQDRGATLPAPERADLVVRLWDHDTTVARRAAEALAAWGNAGLVGLAPLRLLAAQHADAAMRDVFARAAETVLRACTTLPATDLAFVQALEGALRGQAAPAVLASPTVAGLSLAATTLRMAEWNDPAVLGTVLDLFERAGECDDAIDAVYGWLATKDARTADAALAWLARRGAAVRRSIARLTREPLHDECVQLARYCVPEPSRPAAIEATAWFELAGATTFEQDAALASPDTRLQARALASWLAAPGQWRPDREQLRRLATMPADEPLRLTQPMPRGLPPDIATYAFLLSEPVRALAAMALATTDEVLPQPDQLSPVLRRYCDVKPPELAAFVQERQRAGTLSAVLDGIEADCRRRLGVDPALHWPRTAAAKRSLGQ